MSSILAQAPTGQGSISKLNRAIHQIDNAERLILSLNRHYWQSQRERIEKIARALHNISLEIQDIKKQQP